MRYFGPKTARWDTSAAFAVLEDGESTSYIVGTDGKMFDWEYNHWDISEAEEFLARGTWLELSEYEALSRLNCGVLRAYMKLSLGELPWDPPEV